MLDIFAVATDVGGDQSAAASSGLGRGKRKTFGETGADHDAGAVVKLLDDELLGRIFVVGHPAGDPRGAVAVAEEDDFELREPFFGDFEGGNAVRGTFERDMGAHHDNLLSARRDGLGEAIAVVIHTIRNVRKIASTERFAEIEEPLGDDDFIEGHAPGVVDEILWPEPGFVVLDQIALHTF